MMPTNEFVEVRNGGYCLSGTRIGLDVVAYEFRDGRSADAIFEAYPSIGSLEKVYGLIGFIREHPSEIESYLQEQNRRYQEFSSTHPLRSEMIDRFERTKKDRALKQA
jgi:uncharacterized protein (DUF433 family)